MAVDGNPIRPSDKAAGPNLGADLGGIARRPGPNEKSVEAAVLVNDGLGPVPVLNGADFPPLDSGVLGGQKAAVGFGPAVKQVQSTKNQSPKNVDPSPGKNGNLSCLQQLQNEAQRKGSGFFDISRNSIGSRGSPTVETKNSFGTLQDVEDCFDTEYGLWEKDMLMVRKFYETHTQPSDDVFKSWSEKLQAYYVMLTKFDPVSEAMVETRNEDEIEVESETDESARDMVQGI
ncbi:hypothetical protein Hanom_Chr15g01337161 [Helianthus anomalus]